MRAASSSHWRGRAAIVQAKVRLTAGRVVVARALSLCREPGVGDYNGRRDLPHGVELAIVWLVSLVIPSLGLYALLRGVCEGTVMCQLVIAGQDWSC